MPKIKASASTMEEKQPMRPALTPEARENQMISLAFDLVEKRMREGTASSQETTHFLKLASMKEQLEKEKLITENKLLQAKIENLESQATSASLYAEALRAFRAYSGQEEDDIVDDEED